MSEFKDMVHRFKELEAELAVNEPKSSPGESGFRYGSVDRVTKQLERLRLAFAIARHVAMHVSLVVVLVLSGCASAAFDSSGTGPTEVPPTLEVATSEVDASPVDTPVPPLDDAVAPPDAPDAPWSPPDAPDAPDAPASAQGLVSTPGYVACSGPTDACRRSDAERCCTETGSPVCKSDGAGVCDGTKTYLCDEAADCGGSPCYVWPSGGSQCSGKAEWTQLCMTDAECPSGVCKPYSAWSGHGVCS